MTRERAVALAVLGAVLAVQTACSCPEETTRTIVLLPPSDGSPPDEAFFEMACLRECPYGISCEPERIALEGGGEAPALICVEYPDCPSGRRPGRWQGTAPGAAWLVRAAQLEEASVTAFQELASDLQRLGAPRRLVRAARRSAREERRHARLLSSLCRRRGLSALPASVPRAEPVSLQALARANAVEGCVRESHGAAVALWQSRTATDPLVRQAFALIARDETRHAALSWQIDAWARSRLMASERRSLDEVRAEAVQALLAGPAAEAVPELGLPGPVEAQRLTHRLFQNLGLLAGRAA